jgi:hypothetical protein
MLGTFPQELTMNKKMWLAGLISAVIMFFWAFIAHDVLPLGTMMISTTPSEDAVLASIRSNVNGSGFYMLPGDVMNKIKTMPKDQQRATMEQAQARWMAGPRAILIYGTEPSAGFGMLLGREFLSTLFGALIITYVFVMALPNLRTFAHRVVFVTLIGLLPFLIADESLWNFYGFPPAYVLSEVGDYVVGTLLAGIFLAWFYRKEGTTQPSMAKVA